MDEFGLKSIFIVKHLDFDKNTPFYTSLINQKKLNMSQKKCKTGKAKTLKPNHKFECTKCGHSARKKDKLCKPVKV
jgi:hypothetical protein